MVARAAAGVLLDAVVLAIVVQIYLLEGYSLHLTKSVLFTTIVATRHEKVRYFITHPRIGNTGAITHDCYRSYTVSCLCLCGRAEGGTL